MRVLVERVEGGGLRGSVVHLLSSSEPWFRFWRISDDAVSVQQSR